MKSSMRFDTFRAGWMKRRDEDHGLVKRQSLRPEPARFSSKVLLDGMAPPGRPEAWASN
jgi:hypothetical protein